MTEISKLNRPAAFVAVNKNVVKNYDNKVFMADGQEFMIYLVNPTTKTYMAKIKLNGKSISFSGLILRPGEKTWLDCNWDDKRKFVFRTYKVDDSPESKAAIVNNGDVEIEFYAEKELEIKGSPHTTPIYTPWHVPGTPSWPIGTNPFWYGTDGTGNPGMDHVFYCSSVNESAPIGSVQTSCSYTAPVETKSLETGRIEKGGKSDQKFTEVDMDFSFLWSYADRYKIIPLSEKASYTTKEIRKYCSCGRRLKNTHKFCSACGKPVTA